MKKNKKRLIELVCLVAVVAIVCCIPAFARTAKGTYLTEAEIKERKAFLTETGVPDDVLAQLSVGQMDTVYQSLEEGMEYFYYESRESYATEFKDSVVVEPTEQQSPMMTISLLMFKKTENGEDYYGVFPSFRWNEETQLTGDIINFTSNFGKPEKEDNWGLTMEELVERSGLGGIISIWDAEKNVFLDSSSTGGSYGSADVSDNYLRTVGEEVNHYEANAYKLLISTPKSGEVSISLGYGSSEPGTASGTESPQIRCQTISDKLEFVPMWEGNARYCLETFAIEVE